jgi:hypothetical protein
VLIVPGDRAEGGSRTKGDDIAEDDDDSAGD